MSEHHETTETETETKAPRKRAKARRAPRPFRVRVLVRSPYGGPGDVVVANPQDSRIRHYLDAGVLERA